VVWLIKTRRLKEYLLNKEFEKDEEERNKEVRKRNKVYIVERKNRKVLTGGKKT